MTTALEGGEGSASRPVSSLPPGKTRYPLYRRLGGPQGRSGQVRKISPSPGFDPRTVQSVASRYTDYANRPTVVDYCSIYLLRPQPIDVLSKDGTCDYIGDWVNRNDCDGEEFLPLPEMEPRSSSSSTVILPDSWFDKRTYL